MGLSPRLQSSSGTPQPRVLPEGLPETTIPVKNKYFVPPWIGRSQTNFRLAVLNRSLDNDGYVYFLPDIPYVIFGRDPCAAHVFVGHPSVSRQHAVLEWHATNRSCFLTDLGSKTGTTVDGVPLKSYRPQKIYISSKIRFGESNRLYVFEPDPNAMEKANHRFHLRPASKNTAPPPRPGSIPRLRSSAVEQGPREKPTSDTLSLLARPRSENGKSPWTRTQCGTLFKSLFQRVSEEEKERTTGVNGRGTPPILVDSDCEIVQEVFKTPVSSASIFRASISASPLHVAYFSERRVRNSNARQVKEILGCRNIDSDSDSDIEVVEVRTVGHRVPVQVCPSRSPLDVGSRLRRNDTKAKDRLERKTGSVLGKRSWTDRAAERQKARRERVRQKKNGTNSKMGIAPFKSKVRRDQDRDCKSREREGRHGYGEVYKAEKHEERETRERNKEFYGAEENRDKETWERGRGDCRARRSKNKETWERIRDTYKAEESEDKVPWARTREEISPRRREPGSKEHQNGRRARFSPDREEADTYPGREKNWHTRYHDARDAREVSAREERGDVNFRRHVRSHSEREEYRKEPRGVLNESPATKDAKGGQVREERNLRRRRNEPCKERELFERKDQEDRRDCGRRDQGLSGSGRQQKSQEAEREILKGKGDGQNLQRTETLFHETRMPPEHQKRELPLSPLSSRKEVGRRRPSAKGDRSERDAGDARIRADGTCSRTVRDAMGGAVSARDGRHDKPKRQSPSPRPGLSANARKGATRDGRGLTGARRKAEADTLFGERASRGACSRKNGISNSRGLDKPPRAYKNTWWKPSWKAYANPV